MAVTYLLDMRVVGLQALSKSDSSDLVSNDNSNGQYIIALALYIPEREPYYARSYTKEIVLVIYLGIHWSV